MRKSIDKRNKNRTKTVNFFVEYKSKGHVATNVEVINISAGGMCFLRNSVINKGELIQIKFPFRSKRIILNAEVLRIDGREVAVKFINSDNEIDRFISTFNDEYPDIKKMSNNFENKLFTENSDKYKYRGK